MTLREAYLLGQSMLKKEKIPDAQTDAWYLLEHVTGVSRTAYFADQERKISKDQERRYIELVEKRAAHIPLQHLTGYQEFMGLDFSVDGRVLIPRQDTEVLVEHALKLLEMLVKGKSSLTGDGSRSIRILDMCTGSGCILISTLYYGRKIFMIRYMLRENDERNGNIRESDGKNIGSVQIFESVYGREKKVSLEGTGADLSEGALELAAENAARHGVEACWVRGDLFENIEDRYHMILSNPPYIRTAEIEELQEEVRLHDPRMALDGREDGLYFYRRIVSEAREHLEPGGVLAFEIGYDQAEAVSSLMEQAGYTQVSVKKDLAGLDRVVSGVYNNL